MDRTEPTVALKTPAIPGRIAAFLGMVRVLLGYGKHLDTVLPDRTNHRHFPNLAIGFGTLDLRRILAHVQRGILRAMVLQKYLLARASQGRDIAPTPIHGPAKPEDIEAFKLKLRAPRDNSKPRARPVDANDRRHYFVPEMHELEIQVRRRSIARSISDICLDLGITPSACDGSFWAEIAEVFRDFGGDFAAYCEVRRRRTETFEKERTKLPDIGACRIWDAPKEAIRDLLGYLVGESPPALAAIAAPSG